MDAWMEDQMDGWIQMNGQMDGWTNGWIDGWMEIGWMDGLFVLVSVLIEDDLA